MPPTRATGASPFPSGRAVSASSWFPDDATKALQRRLFRRVLARVPVHPAAHGFERGRSIVSNAAPHIGRAVVVRMDVVEFFGSTSGAASAACFGSSAGTPRPPSS